jgi:hypothetical protein
MTKCRIEKSVKESVVNYKREKGKEQKRNRKKEEETAKKRKNKNCNNYLTNSCYLNLVYNGVIETNRQRIE